MIYHTNQVNNTYFLESGVVWPPQQSIDWIKEFLWCNVFFSAIHFFFSKLHECKSVLLVSHVLCPSGVMPERQFGGTQFVCSVVASHVSHQASSSFSFVWIAPPPGTGCVNFLWVQLPTCKCTRITWPPKREKRWADLFVMHSLHRLIEF